MVRLTQRAVVRFRPDRSRPARRLFGRRACMLTGNGSAPIPGRHTNSEAPCFSPQAGGCMLILPKSALFRPQEKSRNSAACLGPPVSSIQEENTHAYFEAIGNWAAGFLVGVCCADRRNRPAKHRKSKANEGIGRGYEHAARAADRQECRRHPRQSQAYQAASWFQD